MARSPLFLRPRSVDVAVSAAAEHPEFILCADGTAVMADLNIGAQPAAPGWLLLQDVAELRGHRETGDGLWRIGLVSLSGLCTFGAIAHALAEAARQAGSGQLRNAATVGGNVVGACATSDLMPALFSLDAMAEITSADRTRVQPVEDFLVGLGQTPLAAGEILTATLVRSTQDAQWYERAGAGRRAFTPLICALAARVGHVAGTARVAVAEGAGVAVRVREAEPLMFSAGQAEELAEAVPRAAAPVDDALAPASYRRKAVALLAERAFAELTIGLQLTGRYRTGQDLLGLPAIVDEVVDGSRAPPGGERSRGETDISFAA